MSGVSKRDFFKLTTFLIGVASLLIISLTFVKNTNAQTNCPDLKAGDLVQFGDSNSVYILNENKKRLYYPSADVFKSWHKDYSEVNKVAKDCSQKFGPPTSFPLGVNYRPGSKLVKTTLDNAVYAVTTGNKIRKIGNEQVARQLHGSDWTSEVVDISTSHWSNFVNKGAEISEPKPYNGMLVSTKGDSSVYYVVNNKLKKIKGDISFLEKDIETVSSSVLEKVPKSNNSMATEAITSNPLQNLEQSASTSKEQSNINDDSTSSVTRVIDGDTIEVNYNGQKEKVRLIGLDTTESKDPRKKVQCFSKEASSQMKQLVSNKEVKLEKGSMSDNRGYYGRLLRYVYLPNGTHVNAWMIKNGYGYAYTKYPFSKQEKFESYEQQARNQKVGLWADGVCEKEQQDEEETTSDYNCSSDVYNCSDFGTYEKAKDVYDSCGGVSNDVHRLDGDNDGTPCESLK